MEVESIKIIISDKKRSETHRQATKMAWKKAHGGNRNWLIMWNKKIVKLFDLSFGKEPTMIDSWCLRVCVCDFLWALRKIYGHEPSWLRFEMDMTTIHFGMLCGVVKVRFLFAKFRSVNRIIFHSAFLPKMVFSFYSSFYFLSFFLWWWWKHVCHLRIFVAFCAHVLRIEFSTNLRCFYPMQMLLDLDEWKRCAFRV